MTDEEAERFCREMVHFGLSGERARLGLAAAGMLIEASASARNNLVGLFAGKLTVAEVVLAGDVGVAIMAASLSPEQIEVGRRLSSMAMKRECPA